MDAIPRHRAPVDQYLIHGPTIDAQLCFGAEDVREHVADFRRGTRFTVLRVTVDEYTRDVTDEFLPDEGEMHEMFGGDYSNSTHFRKLRVGV